MDNHLEQKMLEELKDKQANVWLILRNGYQMRGRVVDFDDVSILFKGADGVEKLVYLSFLSTIQTL